MNTPFTLASTCESGNERGINRNLHAGLFGLRTSNFGLLDDSQQLDGVTELLRELHVNLGNVADAFGVNLVVIHPEPVRERRENADLVLRVVAVDVEVRRRFGVTLLLRVGQHVGEVRALQFHAREDEQYAEPRQ